MIKKAIFEEALINGMQRNLHVSETKSQAISKLGHAVDCLYSAMEIFEEKGLKTQASACEKILAKIASHGDHNLISDSNRQMEEALSRESFEPQLDLSDLDPKLVSILSDDGEHINKDLLDIDINAADLEVDENSADDDYSSFEDES